MRSKLELQLEASCKQIGALRMQSNLLDELGKIKHDVGLLVYKEVLMAQRRAIEATEKEISEMEKTQIENLTVNQDL